MFLQRCVDVYLACGRRIWWRGPASFRLSRLGQSYGRHLHSMVCRYAARNQNHSTFFLRNRPELELMRRLVDRKPIGSSLRIAVLACSKGAEVYSILWIIRRARPDLDVTLHAMDISREIVEFAREGVYSLRNDCHSRPVNPEYQTPEERLAWTTCRDQGPLENVSVFERMSKEEFESMCDPEVDRAGIKPWLRTGITWQVGDAASPELVDELGPQDIVVANRFLCHMDTGTAERCLRNLAHLVKPGGYLFVSGVDLDVRTRVARTMQWEPVAEMLRDVHEGDPSLTSGWPMGWWGLEPFRKDHPECLLRYASVFQIGKAPASQPAAHGKPRIPSPDPTPPTDPFRSRERGHATPAGLSARVAKPLKHEVHALAPDPANRAREAPQEAPSGSQS